MEYKRKEAEMAGRKIGGKASKQDSLKEDIIDMVGGIGEEKFLRRIYIIISDYVKKKPE